MTRRFLSSLIAMALVTFMADAQQLPQFSSSDFTGWSYNNPGVPLTGSAIASGKVYLYVSSNGLVLTLQSPEFSCQGLDSIAAQLYWYSPNCNDSEFNLSHTAVTMTIDDADGNPVDSVTCTPANLVISQNLSLCLPVPHGLATGRLRFVSWQADVTSCGAIKRATLTAIEGHHSGLVGDIDGDGTLSVTDVTSLIDYVLNGTADIDRETADVDDDGDISVTDVTALIMKVLS